MKFNFRKTVIVGPGLIGGSIGLILRKQRISGTVVGVARHKETLRNALKKGAIDKAELDLKKAVVDADLVVLCTPVKAFKNLMQNIKEELKQGCIIFDVGSTKNEIVQQAYKVLPAKVNFVGTHPMAGSEKTGVEFAREDLFKNAVCFIANDKRTKKTAMTKVIRLWKQLGAKCVLVDPLKHDNIVASISHVPHLLSSVLVNSVEDKHLKFAAAGFKDTTRISAGSAEVWHDIALSNNKAILSQIKRFESELKKLKKAIKDNNGKQLIKELEKARIKRQSIN